MDFLSTFPCLIPVKVTESLVIYDGYLNANDEEFRICISTSGTGTLEAMQLACEWRLQHLLAGHRDILEQKLRHCKDLHSYLKELKSVVECLTSEKLVTTGSFTHSQKIIEEMEKIGWEKLVSVDTSFQHLTFQCQDTAHRQHKLIVHINTEEMTAPRCVADLPGKFDFEWSAKGHLSDLLKQFEAVLAKYQLFWDAVAVIDEKTWILEPDAPTYSAVNRRIAISPGTSIQITVDPRHPSAMPHCCFLGADHVINPLKEKLNSNIHLWNNSISLLSNLENLLEVDFPSPSNSKKEDFSLECGICYSYRLGDEIPDKTCDDSHCGQPFHRSCLYEWMRSLPSCQQSFNTIFGECPFCSKPISVKLLPK